MIKVITWDWKAQPPLAKILTAFQEMVDYDQVPQYYLPDTGGDYYACVISEHALSDDEIEQALFPDD